MGWNDVTVNSGGSGANYLSLKAGDTRLIHIIDDEPHSFSSIYFNAIKKSAVVDPENNPAKGVKGFDIRTRHAVNVYDYDDKKVKILAGSNAMFNSIKAIHEEWNGLSGVDLKIQRHGSGFDTEYQIVPTAKCRWNDRLIDGQEVFDLASEFALTPIDVVESYMEGRDKSTEFNPSELEATPEDNFEADPTDVADDVPTAEPEFEEPAAPPVRRAAPVTTRPAPRAAAVPANRNDLIMKLNNLVKTKVRYKKPGAWLADVQRFGGKDKKSMSQLSIEHLQKLFTHVSAVK